MDYTDNTSAPGTEKLQVNYVIVKKIGKGSFGQALLVTSRSSSKRYVAKIVDTASMSDREKRDLQNEIRILAGVHHPNIVRYREHFSDGTFVIIIMDYADGGDLHTRIKEAQRQNPPVLFEPDCVMFWFLQLCMALQYLHENRILHRDIKTANVFLTRHNVVKLGDFGISTVLQSTMACAKTVCGTPYYFSPELCQNRPYNNKSDIWSLGVVLYEALTLQRPFNAKSLKELVKKILLGQYETIPSSVPAEVRGLCVSLLQVNPLQRPSINRILETSYVQHKLQEFSVALAADAAKERLLKEKAQQQSRHHTHSSHRQRSSEVANSATATTNTTPTTSMTNTTARVSNEKEQLAKLRGMNRQHLREMMAQQAEKDVSSPSSFPHAPPASGRIAESDDRDGVSEGVSNLEHDGTEWIEQNEEMLKQAKNIVGSHHSNHEPDNFGEKEEEEAEGRSASGGVVQADRMPCTRRRRRCQVERLFPCRRYGRSSRR